MRDRARTLIWETAQADRGKATVFPTVLGDHEAGFFIHPNSPDKASVAEELASQLRGESHEGARIFSEVGLADRFLGPVASYDRIPDLIGVTRGEIGVADGFSAEEVITEETKQMRGVHHRYGVVLISNEHTLAIQEPAVEDIAPTILALLDVEPPPWMQGHPLLDLAPTKVIPEVGPRAPFVEPELSEQEEQAIEEHLRGLGYVE
jgi:hypothetical protein